MDTEGNYPVTPQVINKTGRTGAQTIDASTLEVFSLITILVSLMIFEAAKTLPIVDREINNKTTKRIDSNLFTLTILLHLYYHNNNITYYNIFYNKKYVDIIILSTYFFKVSVTS